MEIGNERPAESTQISQGPLHPLNLPTNECFTSEPWNLEPSLSSISDQPTTVSKSRVHERSLPHCDTPTVRLNRSISEYFGTKAIQSEKLQEALEINVRANILSTVQQKQITTALPTGIQNSHEIALNNISSDDWVRFNEEELQVYNEPQLHNTSNSELRFALGQVRKQFLLDS